MSNAYSDMKKTKIKVCISITLATFIPILINIIYNVVALVLKNDTNIVISSCLYSVSGLYTLIMLCFFIYLPFIKVVHLNIDGNQVVIYAGLVNDYLFINDELIDYKTYIFSPVQLNAMSPLGLHICVDILPFMKVIVKANNRIVYFNGKKMR